MSTWSADYGTFVLCIAAILSLVALALVRWIDKYQAEQRQYIGNKGAQDKQSNYTIWSERK